MHNHTYSKVMLAFGTDIMTKINGNLSEDSSTFLATFILSSVGPVPETSVPIRFRVLQFEDRFDSGSYLTSRPRFRVGSGRVNGSSICIF